MEKETSIEKVHDAEIVETATGGQITGRQEQTVEMALANAEKHIQKRKGLVKLIAKNIDPRDVVIYGKPPKETVHYAKNACKQILSWIDADILDVRISQTEYNRPSGPYLIFEATGTLVLNKQRRISVTGSRATYDDFFGSVAGTEKPLEEVDIPSVRIAAITNMWNHALEDAGLKPSLEELRDAGLDLKKASYVEFKSQKPADTGQAAQATSETNGKPAQAQGASEASKTGQAPSSELTITEPQAKRMFAIAKNQGYSTEQYRATLYQEFNVSSDRDLKKSVYEKACNHFANNPKGGR